MSAARLRRRPTSSALGSLLGRSAAPTGVDFGAVGQLFYTSSALIGNQKLRGSIKDCSTKPLESSEPEGVEDVCLNRLIPSSADGSLWRSLAHSLNWWTPTVSASSNPPAAIKFRSVLPNGESQWRRLKRRSTVQQPSPTRPRLDGL